MSGITPKFLDPLVLEELDGRYWRVAREFRYDSAVRVIVPQGRISDLSPVPRLPFAYWLAGDTDRKSGLVHESSTRTALTRARRRMLSSTRR